MIYLDTHVLVWLYCSGEPAVPKFAAQAMCEHDILISPIVRLELQYLYEIKKVSAPAATVFDELAGLIGLAMYNKPCSSIVTNAESQAWARDPFDRIIVAQAALSKSPLVTKDEVIHKNYPHALWDQP